MNVQLNCPYCNKLNLKDTSSFLLIDYNIFYQYKCNHCGRRFVFELIMKADTYKLPSDTS